MENIWSMLALGLILSVIGAKVAIGRQIHHQKQYMRGVTRDKDKLLKQLYVVNKQRQSAEAKQGVVKTKKQKLLRRRAGVVKTLSEYAHKVTLPEDITP